MGNLLASLLSSANAMRTFERSLGVVQNNVANVSTPGYASSARRCWPNPSMPRRDFPEG